MEQNWHHPAVAPSRSVAHRDKCSSKQSSLYFWALTLADGLIAVNKNVPLFSYWFFTPECIYGIVHETPGRRGAELSSPRAVPPGVKTYDHAVVSGAVWVKSVQWALKVKGSLVRKKRCQRMKEKRRTAVFVTLGVKMGPWEMGSSTLMSSVHRRGIYLSVYLSNGRPSVPLCPAVISMYLLHLPAANPAKQRI